MGESVRGYGEEPQKVWGRASEAMGKSLRSYGEEPHKLWGRASEVMGKSLRAAQEPVSDREAYDSKEWR
jgi:hypothetical protein